MQYQWMDIKGMIITIGEIEERRQKTRAIPVCTEESMMITENIEAMSPTNPPEVIIIITMFTVNIRKLITPWLVFPCIQNGILAIRRFVRECMHKPPARRLWTMSHRNPLLDIFSFNYPIFCYIDVKFIKTNSSYASTDKSIIEESSKKL